MKKDQRKADFCNERQRVVPKESRWPLAMRLTVVLLLFVTVQIAAKGFAQINLSAVNQPMHKVLNEIQKQSGYDILYLYDLINRYGNVTVELKNANVTEAMEACIKGKELTYSIVDNSILIKEKEAPATNYQQPQRDTLKGKVIEKASGLPIPGANIYIKGTTIGVAASEDGTFKLPINVKNATIVCSCFGMKSIEFKYAGQKTYNFSLEEEVLEIEGAVATGMFVRKKEGFTGAVSKLTSDEIMKSSSGNVLRALQMFDPGFRMNVSNIAGSNPNAIPEFEMRGKSNMGDYNEDDMVLMRGDIDTRPNQPLFVLDGIIGVPVTTIIDIDPAQIESITLLKDAAAMVIYGSRASNGVVVVETKAPEKGNLRLIYNGNYSVQVPDLSVYDLLNAKDKLELEKRAGFYNEYYTAGNAASLNNYYLSKYMDVMRGVNTYWLKDPVQTAFSQRHGFNLEGGDNTIRYKLYFGANSKPGVMKHTGTDIKSGSIDLRYRRNKLLVSNNFTTDYTIGQRSSPYGTFSEYTFLNPYYRKYDENGNIIKELDSFIYRYDSNGNPVRIGNAAETQYPAMNPMYNTLYNQKDQSTTLQLRNAFKVEYSVLPNLRLSSDVTIIKSTDETDKFLPSNHSTFQYTLLEYKGNYQWSRRNMTNYNISFTANYNTVFNDDHLISVFARYDIDERKNHTAAVNMRGFPNDKMDEVFLGAANNSVTGSEGTNRSLGFVGTANYYYRQKYAVDFSVRVDASSEFGRNNRYAPFWSAGGRWNMHREGFIAKSGIFDELVLRSSYGITGSQGFSPYQSLQMYTYENMMRVYHSSPVVGTVLQSIGNPDLKWQQTQNFNLGMDFNMLNRLIDGRFEYYRKRTVNTLLAYSLAPSVGFETITDNMGNVSNNGYEATLRIMPYNNLEKRLNFSFVFNGSHNVNKIEKISNALKVRNEEAANKVGSRPLPRYVEGYSQSIIWAVKSLGIDPVSGREVFLRRDGTMTYQWNSIDQIPVGDTEPVLRGTVGFNLNWGGLSINLAGSYRFGGQAYNRTLLDKVENANLRFNVDSRAYTERWQKPGDVTLFKGITTNITGQSTRASSRFVMDENELLMSSLTVMYRMEQREYKFLKNFGLSSMNIAIYLEDLLRMSSIKMERGIDYPFARQMSMSLNLTF